ncbi:peptidyl-prolyl cis-trans isomerase C [Natronocella acetinitrilica]|jgi:peptidyl-prolyl cis-trans isomerase C|uniref:peptidylprolyl isomerase n=1 Tax=Natronocella acetinitrilica TaxID=414046 RepID=A0AAE3G1M3_9GAMM|nr:peptidylprolyl isomerase [Natronocella acetinitrilica]MCP1673538.1 peptidyl-prolyl cis-trans isomerase C [Natronocella acetinitrilica]
MSIQVNGREISSREINIESAHHQEPGADPRHAWRRAAVALTVRELMLQRARQVDLTVPDDPEGQDAALDALVEREVNMPAAEEDECRRWYEQNLEAFRSPDLVEVRHILLAAAPEDMDGRDVAREQAEALLSRLEQEPRAFPAMAAAHSRCSSSAEGGHLGQVSRGQTVPEFEDVVLRLPVGLAGRPVETRYGFHVVEVLQRIPGEQLPFDAAKTKIKEYLEERTRRRAIHQYIRLLAGEADIKGIDLDASESMLIQ